MRNLQRSLVYALRADQVVGSGLHPQLEPLLLSIVCSDRDPGAQIGCIRLGSTGDTVLFHYVRPESAMKLRTIRAKEFLTFPRHCTSTPQHATHHNRDLRKEFGPDVQIASMQVNKQFFSTL